jgi:hypothetical protein
MSIKKLGGTRLRLVVGLAAVLAIFGVVLAFGAPKPPLTVTFNPATVNGLAVAKLEIRNASATTTYYFRPNDLEVENNDYEAWMTTGSGNGQSVGSPISFTQGTSPKFFSFPTDVNGNADIYIQTSNPSEADDEKQTSVEMRSGSETGTIVGTGSLLVLQQ